MRLSVDDPRSRFVEGVWFNGVQIKNAVEVDTDEGWVRVVVMTSINGKTQPYLEHGDFVFARYEGKVEIRGSVPA